MNFNDGKYLKAKDKENIYKAMERFIKSDFDQSKFTSNLYKYLSLHFGFIAHYNANGFFESRFEDPDGRIQTYKQIEEAGPWEFKDENTSACADLNRAIVDLVKANKAKFTEDAYTKKIKNLREQQADINDELERITGLKKVTGTVEVLVELQNKYGIKAAPPVHTDDWLLRGFTYDDLITAVYHNEKVRDEKAVMKVYKELLGTSLKDAEYSVKAMMKTILAELQEKE